jgi:hypothetical protein
LLVTLPAAFAADIDGKWKSEHRIERNGQAQTITMFFDLKADGPKLTGKVMVSSPRGDKQADIASGKLDGNKFSFVTMVQSPKGLLTTKYIGTVEGDMLKGVAERKGGTRSVPFEAKKQ